MFYAKCHYCKISTKNLFPGAINNFDMKIDSSQLDREFTLKFNKIYKNLNNLKFEITCLNCNHSVIDGSVSKRFRIIFWPLNKFSRISKKVLSNRKDKGISFPAPKFTELAVEDDIYLSDLEDDLLSNDSGIENACNNLESMFKNVKQIFHKLDRDPDSEYIIEIEHLRELNYILPSWVDQHCPIVYSHNLSLLSGFKQILVCRNCCKTSFLFKKNHSEVLNIEKLE